ncbi:MAG TPA: MerR family transcriptional regulator [Polyangia bacterium]|jgi:DNA-binding transcriptional MerR regulator|nr:MerR family transcriptional regulator [Polyangia bacterium]
MTKPLNLPGLKMEDVTARTGTSKRRIYGWIRAGLLPAPASSGRGVRYDEAYVERIMTIARLRYEGLSVAEVRRRLENPPARQEEPAPPIPMPEAAPAGATPAAAPDGLPSERWERIVLLPGLEVSYRTDGGPVLHRLAAEIWRQFGAPAR